MSRNNLQTYANLIRFVAGCKDITTLRSIKTIIAGDLVKSGIEIEEVRQEVSDLIDNCKDNSLLYKAYDEFVNIPLTNTYSK